MSSLRVVSLCLSAACLAAPAAHAAPVSLNVNPGLWQITATGQMTGTPQLPETAGLSPAQKAQMEAMMAAVVAGMSKPHTYKQCITKADLEKGFDPSGEDHPDCQVTVTANTGTVMEAKVVCSGAQEPSGTFHFEAASPVAINGVIHMTMAMGGSPVEVQQTLTGQWLGAQCGNVQ